MPPFRLLHAAGLDPDPTLAELPRGLSDSFTSAPLLALERLVARAIELRVDALLLTPRLSLDGLPDLPGLALEAALRNERERLAEEAIPLLIAVGTRGTGWERLADRDSKIILLTPGSYAPLADRNGLPAAVLRCVEQPTLATGHVVAGPNDVLELAVAPRLGLDGLREISMLRHDYLALGAGPRGTASLTAGHAHAPGSLQGANSLETGARGATLATIDAGRVTLEFVPTAAVRFESASIESDSSDQIDDLAIRMAERLEAFHPEPGEQAWSIHWWIEAAGTLFELLDTPAGREQLVELLPEAIGDLPVAHRLSVVPHALWPALDDPLAAEFAAALQEQAAGLADATQRLALLDLPATLPRRNRIARLVAGAPANQLLGGARRFGLRITTATAHATGDDAPASDL